jgi:hypothetical protein
MRYAGIKGEIEVLWICRVDEVTVWTLGGILTALFVDAYIYYNVLVSIRVWDSTVQVGDES